MKTVDKTRGVEHAIRDAAVDDEHVSPVLTVWVDPLSILAGLWLFTLSLLPLIFIVAVMRSL